MKIQDVLLYAEGVMKKVGNQLTAEERNALFDMMSLVRHEFSPVDDVRSVIDDQICRVRWMKEDIEEISKEEGICLTHNDIIALIHQPGFSKWLKESCEIAGNDFIALEVQKYDNLGRLRE